VTTQQDSASSRQEAAALQQQLDRSGLRVRDVLGDGNCLFRAVSCALYGDENSHRTIRSQVVAFMRANADSFAPFVEDDVTFEDVCCLMPHSPTHSLARH
jgi:OTU domain-containing protein 3